MGSNPLAPAVHEESAAAPIYRAAVDGADWFPADRVNAVQEGWDLLPGARGPAIGSRADQPIFASDEAVMRHVMQSASTGSDMHRRALAIHATARSRDAARSSHYVATPLADVPWTERLGEGARQVFPFVVGIGTLVLSWWLPPPVWVWVRLALRLLARFHH
jgi:hypothetical protein